MSLTDKLALSAEATAAGESTGNALDIYEKVKRQQEAVADALPAGMDPGRFVRMVLTEMKRTPKLATCSPVSVLGAMMLSAQTGLEPGGPLGPAFLIPRWNSREKCNEAQFQIGYKGYVQLAARSGVTIVARTVRTDDEFEWAYGTDEYIRHRPVLDSQAIACAWYAIGFIPGRHAPFVVIDRNVADKARKAAASPDRGPWSTNYDEMALKTSILRLKNFLPLSTDVATAMAVDGAVVLDEQATVEQVAAEMDVETPEDQPELEEGES